MAWLARLQEAVEGLARLRHALLGERPHLVRDCELFEGVFGHSLLREGLRRS